MTQTRYWIVGLSIVTALLCCWPSEAPALEKYGRPLPSMEETETEERAAEETLFGGYFMTAAFVHNPSFAARPDNTGLVGMRYMLHLETDLYKQYLTFYTDQNFFSDRTNGWIELSEWDGTYAFTGVVDHFNWRLQYERDAPINPARGLKQIYADGLVTGKIQSAQDMAWWRRLFPHQSLTMYAGAGWLFHNENYFARPDNTGQALFRYVAHADLDLYKNKVVLYGDINMFSDRELSNKVKPTELDWIVGIALHWRNMEFAFYSEQDMPLDRPGLIQKYLAVQLRFSFDVSKQDLGISKPSVREVIR
ncbi:MAG TPA: hypothetical protein VLE03_09410 [Nitrospiraceae bacterium]|nr:hypothetical protein [Nitrospiraceae bacterium]